MLYQIQNQPKALLGIFPSCLAPSQITVETLISTDFWRSRNYTDIAVL